jgi:hypothetical protein
VRILTLVAIAAFVLLVAALVHAHEKHTAPALPPAVLDVESLRTVIFSPAKLAFW